MFGDWVKKDRRFLRGLSEKGLKLHSWKVQGKTEVADNLKNSHQNVIKNKILEKLPMGGENITKFQFKLFCVKECYVATFARAPGNFWRDIFSGRRLQDVFSAGGRQNGKNEGKRILTHTCSKTIDSSRMCKEIAQKKRKKSLHICSFLFSFTLLLNNFYNLSSFGGLFKLSRHQG